MFLKFGIQFKDKIEMVENVADIDYDAFINYKCVMLLTVTSTKIKTQDIFGFFKKIIIIGIISNFVCQYIDSFLLCI